jgi:hypothetical protein
VFLQRNQALGIGASYKLTPCFPLIRGTCRNQALGLGASPPSTLSSERSVKACLRYRLKERAEYEDRFEIWRFVQRIEIG